MKNYILIISFLFPSLLWGQDIFDAQRLSQTDISGTARYVSMGGAFSALGGDASAAKENPAALGVYRSSEFSLSFDLSGRKSSSTMLGVDVGNERNVRFGLSQASIIMNLTNKTKTSGLVGNTFSFSYHRLHNFYRNLGIKGAHTGTSMTDYMEIYTNQLKKEDFKNDPYNNSEIGWLSILAYDGYLINPIYDNAGVETGNWATVLGQGEKVTPSYRLTERGRTDEYTFSWGGNISNRLYLGIALNLLDLEYALTSRYEEGFEQEGGFKLENVRTTSGSGANFSAGVIFRPTDALRLGFALKTPTFYSLEESYGANLDYDSYDVEKKVGVSGTVKTPTAQSSYSLNSPLRLNAGAALVLGKRGLVSVQYDFDNYRGMRLAEPDRKNSPYFTIQNSEMKSQLKAVHTFKIGAEIKLATNYALRGGFAHQSSSSQPTTYRVLDEPNIKFYNTRTDSDYFIDYGTNYASLGVGYRNNFFFADVAYQYKMHRESWFAYDAGQPADSSPRVKGDEATILNSAHNIIVTVGIRF